MLKVAIWNLKGGQAKSTTALNLGAVLASLNLNVLLIDLDGQRTLSFALGMDGKTPSVVNWLEFQENSTIPTQTKNLSLIPGDIALFRLSLSNNIISKSLKGIRGYDVCLIDCPPSLGAVTVQAVVGSDRVLIPILSEPAALKGLSEAVQLIKEERPSMPIDVARVRYRQRLLMTQEADEMLVGGADDLGYRLLYTAVPENVAVSEAIAAQKPVIEYSSKSTGAKAYQSMGKEVKKLWRLGNDQ